MDFRCWVLGGQSGTARMPRPGAGRSLCLSGKAELLALRGGEDWASA